MFTDLLLIDRKMIAGFVLALVLLVLNSISLFSQPNCYITDKYGNRDTIFVDCDYDPSVELTAHYDPIYGRQTDKYGVESIPFSPISSPHWNDYVISGYNQNQNIAHQDVFGGILDLPFDFCFFEKAYNQIVISDNGIVSFNVSKRHLEAPYIVKHDIPSSYLPQNSIFGVFHDMLNDVNVAKVKTTTIGTAPFRQFIIFFDDLQQYNSNTPNSSSQIVLHESSNLIDVHVINKSQSGNLAVIGIMNDGTRGSKGLAPDGRNKGNWEAKNESWRFFPVGDFGVIAVWYDMSGGYVSGFNPYAIKNPSTQSYQARFIYSSTCSNFVINDTIHIKVDKSFTIKDSYSSLICANTGEKTSIDLTWVESDIITSSQPGMVFSYSYYENYNDAANKISPIPNPENYLDSTSTSLTSFVRVETGANCFSIASIFLQIVRSPVLTKTDSIKICDEGNDYEENGVKLKSLIASMHGISINQMYLYPTRSDAESGRNSIPSSNNYTIKTTAPSRVDSVFLRVFSNSDTYCYNIYKTVLVLNPYIEADSIKYVACGKFYGDSLRVDLTKILSDSLSGLPPGTKAEFYKDPDYTNPYTNPADILIVLDAVIYVKLTAADHCDTNTVILITATDCGDGNGGGGGGGFGGGEPPAFCDTIGDITVNLYSYLDYHMKGMSLSDISDVNFYILSEGGVPVTNPRAFSFTPSPTYYGNFRATYRINAGGTGRTDFIITVSAGAVIPSDSLRIDICDTYNDGREFVDLRNFDIIFEEKYMKLDSKNIKYFTSDSLRSLYIENMKNPTKDFSIDSLTISDSHTTIYVFINSFGCFYNHELELYLLEIEIKEIPRTVCDFNEDGEENIDLEVLVDETRDSLLLMFDPSDILSLEVYAASDDAHIRKDSILSNAFDRYLVHDGDTVFVRADILNNCPIIYAYLIKLSSASDLPLIQDTTLCDIGNNNEEDFNLQALINGSSAGLRIDFYSRKIKITDLPSPYYIGSYDKNTALNYTITTLPTDNGDTIFVHVSDSTTLCESILPIYFTLLEEPTLNNDTIQICDMLNDGKELVLIADIKKQLRQKNPALVSIDTALITLHDTQSDAENNINKYISEINITSTTKLWVRIDNGACYIVEELNVVLEKTPILALPNTFFICNNNSLNDDGKTKEIISLVEYKDSLGLNNANDYRISFYSTWEKASIGNNSLSLNNYTIQSFPDTVYVRVINKRGCFSVDMLKFEQYLSLDSVILDSVFLICDFGGLSETVNLPSFARQMIPAPYTINDFNISYHDSKEDAVDNTPTTEDLLAYPMTPSSVVWFSFQYNQTGCRLIKQLQADIRAKPKSVDVEITACDESDGIYDGIFEIDFDQLKAQIIPDEPNVGSLWTFTYHMSIFDAENNIDALPKPYQLGDSVFVNYVDTIFVRTKRTDEVGCSSISKIIVHTQAKAQIDITWKDSLILCDGLENDGIAEFILPSLSDICTTGDSVRFYQHFSDAQQRSNPIRSTSYANVNPFSDSIFVRLSADGFCDTIAKINLLVHPTYEMVRDTTVCEKELPFQYGDSIFPRRLTSGIYPVVFKTINGCDSLINLSVTVLPNDDVLIVDSICAGERYSSYNFDIQTRASIERNVILYDSIMSINRFGCDSITRLSLYVNPLDSVYIHDTICPGERYLLNNFDIQTEIQPDKQILTAINSDINSYGCDSITVLSLIVSPEIIFTASSDLFMFRPDGIYAEIDINNTPAGNQYKYEISHSLNTGALIETISEGKYRVFEYGYYHIVVTDEYDCQRDTTIFVNRKCPVFSVDASPEVCAEESLFHVDYNMEDGYPDRYSIEFENKAIVQEFENEYNKIIASPQTNTSIEIRLPNKMANDYVRPDVYRADLILYNAACRDLSQRIPFSFTVLYPSWIIVQKWNNVIALLNDKFNGGYLFSSYQWMKNGELLRGEDYSYIYIGEGNSLAQSSDYYQIMLTRSDDAVTLPCCPLVPTYHSDLTQYPYLSAGGEIRFSVKKTGGNAYLWNATGVLLGIYSIDTEDMGILAPEAPGVYLLEIRNEQKPMTYKILIK